MDCELAVIDVFGVDTCCYQFLGQSRCFAWGDKPANDVAGVNIEDDVEVEPLPFVWSGEFGDVPGPNLVWSSGRQFGFDVCWVAALVAAIAELMAGSE